MPFFHRRLCVILVVYIDSDLSMHTRPAVCRRLLCSSTLRPLRSIRRDVPSSVYQSLVIALVLSRLDYGNATLADLRACLLNRLQSVLSAAAGSIAGLRCSKHIADALTGFLWLRVPERIKFKLAITVYRALHVTAPQYLSDRLQYVADLPRTRQGRLRWSTSSLLDVRSSRLVTVGDRSLAAAGPRLWNSLPADVQSAPSLTTFRKKLKTHLFWQSYRDIVL